MERNIWSLNNTHCCLKFGLLKSNECVCVCVCVCVCEVSSLLSEGRYSVLHSNRSALLQPVRRDYIFVFVKKKEAYLTFSLFQKLRVSMTFISPYLRDRFIKALQSVKCAHYTIAKGALLRGVAADGRR